MVRLSASTKRDAVSRDLDVQCPEMDKLITAGAFPIWRRRAPLSNSSAERFTKQSALSRAHTRFPAALVRRDEPRLGPVSRLSDSIHSFCRMPVLINDSLFV